MTRTTTVAPKKFPYKTRLHLLFIGVSTTFPFISLLHHFHLTIEQAWRHDQRAHSFLAWNIQPPPCHPCTQQTSSIFVQLCSIRWDVDLQFKWIKFLKQHLNKNHFSFTCFKVTSVDNSMWFKKNYAKYPSISAFHIISNTLQYLSPLKNLSFQQFPIHPPKKNMLAFSALPVHGAAWASPRIPSSFRTSCPALSRRSRAWKEDDLSEGSVACRGQPEKPKKKVISPWN